MYQTHRVFASIAIFFAGATTAHGQTILAESRFNTDTEGWTLVKSAGETPFAPGGSVPISHVAEGGNPGGYLHQVDPNENRTSYWNAPSKFLGVKSGAYGAALAFDMKQSHERPSLGTLGRDVVIEGAGIILAFALEQPPGMDWTQYNVSLTETGWHIDSAAGLEATETDMRQVLGSLTAIYIRAEFRSGDETDDLDNVVLTGFSGSDPDPDDPPNGDDTDYCPDDPEKLRPGRCGCGNPETSPCGAAGFPVPAACCGDAGATTLALVPLLMAWQLHARGRRKRRR
ncbi:MAG TPA: laminin B domain-containing protein [Phycisphaerae bacterium]|nr:laminin B domain-containing protein [Phycisphaerae bacterium]